MNSRQRWFEDDEEFRRRIAEEADERTIELASGSSPSPGWLESPDDYRTRIRTEANEYRIEGTTGAAPSPGWLESTADYQNRIEQEANEGSIEKLTGSAPSPGWFESEESYRIRIRQEANEIIVEKGEGTSPRQAWFESDHDYRSRIAHEARQSRAEAGEAAETKLEWESSDIRYTEASSSPSPAQSGPRRSVPASARPDPRVSQVRVAAAMSSDEREAELTRRRQSGRPGYTSAIPLVSDSELVYLTLFVRDPLPKLVWWTRLDLSPPHQFEILARQLLDVQCAKNPDIAEATDLILRDGSWRIWGWVPDMKPDWHLADYLATARQKKRLEAQERADEEERKAREQARTLARRPHRQLLRAFGAFSIFALVVGTAGFAYLTVRLWRMLIRTISPAAPLGEATLHEMRDAWQSGVVQRWIRDGRS
jgi:hypothetical protein